MVVKMETEVSKVIICRDLQVIHTGDNTHLGEDFRQSLSYFYWIYHTTRVSLKLCFLQKWMTPALTVRAFPKNICSFLSFLIMTLVHVCPFVRQVCPSETIEMHWAMSLSVAVIAIIIKFRILHALIRKNKQTCLKVCQDNYKAHNACTNRLYPQPLRHRR